MPHKSLDKKKRLSNLSGLITDEDTKITYEFKIGKFAMFPLLVLTVTDIVNMEQLEPLKDEFEPIQCEIRTNLRSM